MWPARDTDADGTLDERAYYLQNWRADVVGLVDDTGVLLERVRYSAYGTPTLLSRADITTTGSGNGIPDGDVNNSDFSEYVSLWSASDAAADVTTNGTNNGLPDGSVTLSDYTYWNALFGNEDVKNWGSKSLSHQGSRRGCSGSSASLISNLNLLHARNRWMLISSGIWLSRDALQYIDGAKLYALNGSNPVRYIDPFGLAISGCGGGENEDVDGDPDPQSIAPKIVPRIGKVPSIFDDPPFSQAYCNWLACRKDAVGLADQRKLESRYKLGLCMVRADLWFANQFSAGVDGFGENFAKGVGSGAFFGGILGTCGTGPVAPVGWCVGTISGAIVGAGGVGLITLYDTVDTALSLEKRRNKCHEEHEARLRAIQHIFDYACGPRPPKFHIGPGGDPEHPFEHWIGPREFPDWITD